MLSGQNAIAPATFDGTSIEFFGNAASLLQNSDLQLVAEDGETTRVGMDAARAHCGIVSATLQAVPRPDGNSLVEATITSAMWLSLHM